MTVFVVLVVWLVVSCVGAVVVGRLLGRRAHGHVADHGVTTDAPAGQLRQRRRAS